MEGEEEKKKEGWQWEVGATFLVFDMDEPYHVQVILFFFRILFKFFRYI